MSYKFEVVQGSKTEIAESVNLRDKRDIKVFKIFLFLLASGYVVMAFYIEPTPYLSNEVIRFTKLVIAAIVFVILLFSFFSEIFRKYVDWLKSGFAYLVGVESAIDAGLHGLVAEYTFSLLALVLLVSYLFKKRSQLMWYIAIIFLIPFITMLIVGGGGVGQEEIFSLLMLLLGGILIYFFAGDRLDVLEELNLSRMVMSGAIENLEGSKKVLTEKEDELLSIHTELQDQQDALLNILEDVSGEKVLREQESESMLEVIGEGIIVTDEGGKISYVNPAFEKMLGFAFGELEDQVLVDAIKTYDLKKNELSGESWASKIEKSKPMRKVLIDKKQGGKLAVLVGTSPIYVDKEFRGIVRVVHDYSVDLALQQQKDDFFSIASHELRTPLTVIAGNLDNVLQGYGKSKISKVDNQLLNDVMSAADRLIRMVNDFLNVSRLDQGRVKLEIEPMNAKTMTEKIVKEMTPLVKEKGITLSYSSSSSSHMIMADIDKYREVVVNILGNSLKFTKKGGITILHEKKGSMLRTVISDTGIGIAKSKQKLLFQRFQQAMSRTLAREAGGTGLGLYISREFVQLMDGEMNLVESDIGKGATFDFVIPLAKKGAKRMVVNEEGVEMEFEEEELEKVLDKNAGSGKSTKVAKQSKKRVK